MLEPVGQVTTHYSECPGGRGAHTHSRSTLLAAFVLNMQPWNLDIVPPVPPLPAQYTVVLVFDMNTRLVYVLAIPIPVEN